MPVAKPTICGIESRRHTKAGRFYQILQPPKPPYPSVTTVENVIAKQALYHWYAKMERQAVMAVAADMFEELSKPLVISTGITRETYLSLLESRIGKAKAATKAVEAAGEIGSQAHAMIEWHIRGLLGLSVGPPPKICTAASWAFMAFQDWARSIELLPLRSEQVVFSHVHRYAGTLDLLAYIMRDGQRRLGLVDFKTGKAVYAEAYLQLAAYRQALIEMGLETADACFVVRLPKIETDPEFEVVEVENVEEHFAAFLAARQLWEWQQVQEAAYREKVRGAQ